MGGLLWNRGFFDVQWQIAGYVELRIETTLEGDILSLIDTVKVTKLPLSKEKQKKTESPFNLVDHPELIGLCRGVMADGTINLAEAEYIQQWLGERSNLIDSWPASELYSLLTKVLKDGELSETEEQELRDMLEEVVGDPVSLIFW